MILIAFAGRSTFAICDFFNWTFSLLPTLPNLLYSLLHPSLPIFLPRYFIWRFTIKTIKKLAMFKPYSFVQLLLLELGTQISHQCLPRKVIFENIKLHRKFYLQWQTIFLSLLVYVSYFFLHVFIVYSCIYVRMKTVL